MLNSNILEATLSVKQAVQKIFEAKFDNYEKVKAKKRHEELMIVCILFSEVSGFNQLDQTYYLKLGNLQFQEIIFPTEPQFY